MVEIDYSEDELKVYDIETQELEKSNVCLSYEASRGGIKAGIIFDQGFNIEKSLKKSIEYNPENTEAYAHLAVTEAYLGNLQSAREYALKAQELYKKQNHIGGQDYIERFLKALNEHEAKLAQKSTKTKSN